MAAITYTARRGASLLGDELGVWMADDTAETLVGSELAPDLTTYADQAAAVADGWLLGTGWTFDSANDEFDKAAGTASLLEFPLTTVIGESYLIVVTVANRTAGSVTIDLEGTTGTARSTNATFQETYLCATTNAKIQASADATFDGSVKAFAIRLAVPDLSTENNGLGVYGSVVKSAVNTGAGLMGYGGWSTSNYLKQPYNSALDFGTGDFCYMGWFRIPAVGSGHSFLYQRTDGGASWGAVNNYARVISSGELNVNVGGVDYLTTTTYRDDKYHHLAVARLSGVLYIYIDGSLIRSHAAAGTVTDTSGTLYFGVGVFGGVPNASNYNLGDLALWKVSTGRTAAQIKSIYNDEKHLFEPYSKYTQIGADYSFDVDLSSRGMSRMSNRSENKPIQGPSEVLLFNDWREWDVTNTPRTRSDMAEVTEFMTSSLGGGTITFDPYGTAAAPDTPLTCQVGGDSFSESETILGWRQISFKVRET